MIEELFAQSNPLLAESINQAPEFFMLIMTLAIAISVIVVGYKAIGEIIKTVKRKAALRALGPRRK